MILETVLLEELRKLRYEMKQAVEMGDDPETAHSESDKVLWGVIFKLAEHWGEGSEVYKIIQEISDLDDEITHWYA